MKNRYGKILTLIIVLMLALMTLEACSSGSGDTEPVVTEEPPAEERFKVMNDRKNADICWQK